MKFVILGCGRVGSMLTRQLVELGHHVTIIDMYADAFRRISDVEKAVQVVGSGIDETVLRQAGLNEADAFVALTNGDNTNLMSVQIAKHTFNVKMAVARIYDPIRAEAYRQLGIDTVCTSLVGCGLFRDLLLGKPWGAVSDYIPQILDQKKEQEG